MLTKLRHSKLLHGLSISKNVYNRNSRDHRFKSFPSSQLISGSHRLGCYITLSWNGFGTTYTLAYLAHLLWIRHPFYIINVSCTIMIGIQINMHFFYYKNVNKLSPIYKQEIKNYYSPFCGATTLSITTLSIMTLNIIRH